jgi:hypothetical protein
LLEGLQYSLIHQLGPDINPTWKRSSQWMTMPARAGKTPGTRITLKQYANISVLSIHVGRLAVLAGKLEYVPTRQISRPNGVLLDTPNLFYIATRCNARCTVVLCSAPFHLQMFRYNFQPVFHPYTASVYSAFSPAAYQDPSFTKCV